MNDGQQLAVRQLSRIARLSNGVVELLDITEPQAGFVHARIRVSLDGIERAEAGLALRARETFLIEIGLRFPYEPPWIFVEHDRWIDSPHVIGRSLCLYLATSVEWEPADGMHGFVERLELWLTKAAVGDLDPVGVPAHPPVPAYTAMAKAGPLLFVRANTPALDNPNLAFAHLQQRHEHRLDLVRWSHQAGEAPDLVALSALTPHTYSLSRYPQHLAGLLTELTRLGIPYEFLIGRCVEAATANPTGTPLIVVVGTANRGTTGQRLAQHLVAFQVSPEDADTLRSFAHQRAAVAAGQATSVSRRTIDAATQWLNSPAPLAWLTVHDARPEITVRRDTDTPMAHLYGKTVEVWGCGALGSWAAEYLDRAGAAKVVVRDRSVVRPGLEVRQPYGDDDIGYAKAERLAHRLRSLGLPCEIESYTGDVIDLLRDDKLPDVDLIIDATASRGVAAALERVAARAAQRPWLASMLTDATATRGALFIAAPHAGGALLDVGHRASLALYADPNLHHFYNAFLAPTRNDALLQPEPGCSEPTFRGSAADAAAIAGQLITLTANAIGDPSTTAAARFVALAHAPLAPSDHASCRLDWPARWSALPEHSGYIARLSPDAEQTMRDLALATGRRKATETGGLLFGEWDDAARVVWVDTATKPPKDSKLSPGEFICGTKGTAKQAERLRKASDGATICIGTWHTHPTSSATPSPKDHDTMQRIMASTESAAMHALMVILGGPPEHPDIAGYIENLNEDKP